MKARIAPPIGKYPKGMRGVERVVPNALNVGPRSAPSNALGTTRSTTLALDRAKLEGAQADE